MNPIPKCDHTYKLKSGKVFRCDTVPHSAHPSAHYFVRDKTLEGSSVTKQGSRLVVIPGERRDA